MTPFLRSFGLGLLVMGGGIVPLARADDQTLTIAPPPAAAGPVDFKMGTARRPDGRELTVDRQSLRLDGRPWVPVMGEFHFSRYPAAEWRRELLKMKAGGVDVVSTYVFWIHHEEVEGTWDWSGQRNLRQFVEAVRDAGLSIIVRCGPWAHGEVRNGGLPEWAVVRKDWKTRSTDPRFLEAVRGLYGQIAAQLHGLLWKDGGPVVGVQVDNEYRGPAEYLLALKGIAKEVGLDVPLYTRTGWPALTTPMPAGEILPLYGVYAEGFWDREITPMPGRYWSGFHFSGLRSDAAIATEMLGKREAKDDPDTELYPYLTCEIGGGMMNSYHRRILVDPRDVESTTLVKVGSGSTLPGYYMYHGGENPDGKLSTLMETQTALTTNYNDLPVKAYDFQAPLGEFGQIRPQYHFQRRLHLFLRDFGPALAGMATNLPTVRPNGRDDVSTLRWSARSDGHAGFVFINNYERLKNLPAKSDVQFRLTLADGSTLNFPTKPVTIPADAICFWPFNFDLGHRATLAWATAQPVCAIDDGKVRTVFFAASGVPATFYFSPAKPGPARLTASKAAVYSGSSGNEEKGPYTIAPGRTVAMRVRGEDGGAVQIVVLSEADSLALWKGTWGGRDVAVLSQAGVIFNGSELELTSTSEMATPDFSIFPAREFTADGKDLREGELDGVFLRYRPPGENSRKKPLMVMFEPVQPPGPAREIHNAALKGGVPQAPSDADFAKAAVWKIKLPAGLDLARQPLIRFHYTGDVARITLGGRLLTDDFYNGRVLDLGLNRFAPEVLRGDLRLEVLPLRQDAPIYLAPSAKPDFGHAVSVAGLSQVDLIESQTLTLTAR